MKTLKSLKTIALLFVATISLTSCDDDDNNIEIPQQLNIVETALAVNDLSILADAVVQAGLVDALSASGQRTVFAPTNAAFTDFLEDKGFNSLSEIPNEVLTQILLNHVIDGSNIQSSTLVGTSGYVNTLADGPNSTKLSLFFNGNSGVILNGEADVIIPDVPTSNGIVHVVDEVIDLPTIGTFATTNDALSILVDALAYADTDDDATIDFIDTVLDAEAGPFTVFAPTNAAFAALLVDLEVSALTDIETSTVDAVLLNHIVSGNVQSSQLVTGDVTTLGGPITLDATALTLTDTRMRTSNIVPSLIDIQATNGVVHVIDQVLLPAE